MSVKGLEIIDHSAHITHEWINELAERLDWSSKQSALRLLRTVLHIVRDHLLTDELAQFSAQLPLLVRGMLFEGWDPANTPADRPDVKDFEAVVSATMDDTSDYRGHGDIRCVFDLLNNRISHGEVEDMRACVPAHIREIWPAP